MPSCVGLPRYFAKTDASGVGDTATQKGAIGIFNATRARAVHETLFITNPDREWVLTGANTLTGQQAAAAWAVKINELAPDAHETGQQDIGDLCGNVGFLDVAPGAGHGR